jgi:hypothetical protein
MALLTTVGLGLALQWLPRDDGSRMMLLVGASLAQPGTFAGLLCFEFSRINGFERRGVDV